VVYPFLKFYTYWAQLGGAILMACVVPTAWAACMTVSGDSTTFDLDFLATLLATNGPLLAACFMIEVLFSFVHETVYGCQVTFHLITAPFELTLTVQDTPEDMKLGVYSTSILLGYSGSKRVVLWLTPLYIGTLACTLNAANLHGYVLSVVPGYVLVRDACKIKMDDPISCSMYARRGIYVKVGICIGAALDLAFINAKRSIPSI
jgi:4-hydroxybenzoate polyprenyltransferase